MKKRRYRKGVLVTAARKRNPLRLDPSRTATLRRTFVSQLRKRFLLLQKAVVHLIVEEDALGLKESSHDPFALNERKYPIPQEEPQPVHTEKSCKILEVPDVRQRDHYSCGAAASMVVGRYLGVGPETLPQWKEALGTDVEQSTHPQAIVGYFQSLGCTVIAQQELGLGELRSYIEAGMPVIVPVQDYGPWVPPEARFDYGHYLVVIGVGMGYVFCQDSSEDNVIADSGSVQKPGRVMIDAEDFLRLWHDKDVYGNEFIRYGIAVGPPSATFSQEGNAPLDVLGGVIPEDKDRAKAVDFVTLPPGVSGTNCGNCRFVQTGFCTHPKVRFAVNDRNCCALWDSVGTERAWESPAKNVGPTRRNEGGLPSDSDGRNIPGFPSINAFCPTGPGGGVDPTCSPGQGGAGTKLQEIGKFVKGLPDKIYQQIKDKVKEKYAKLEKRYGATYAKAIIGAALAGVPVPLPGASLVTAAPVIALAEMHRLISPLTGNLVFHSQGSEEGFIAQAVQELLADLHGEVWIEGTSHFSPGAGHPAHSVILSNTRWKFSSDPQKLKQFQAWLKQQFGKDLTSPEVEELWRRFIESGFRKGAGRAFDDTRAAVRVAATEPQQLDFYQGTKQEFLRSAFGRPVAVEKVQLLAARSFDEMQNVTADLSQRMSRTLADGLVQGKSPRQIADDLEDDIGFSRQRAELIARTEIIRAHAEGQLEALEQMGVEEVGAAVEFSSAGDDTVCPECEALEGVVLKVEEARGIIPVHPNCRCAWIPANVGEDTEGQKRSKSSIDAALHEADIDLSVSKSRPQSTLNVFCATGVGGGVDPSCGKEGGSSGGSGSKIRAVGKKALQKLRLQAQAKAATALRPTAEEVAAAHEKIDRLGADRYEANIRGSSKDRRASRLRLLKEFGDGTTCGCVYCGVELNENTLTRDKIYTAREGGKYRHDNLVPACLACNQSRSDTPFRDIQWK